MKKKFLTFLTVAAIGAALVTGCGGSANDVETVAPEDSIAATIVVEEESSPYANSNNGRLNWCIQIRSFSSFLCIASFKLFLA